MKRTSSTVRTFWSAYQGHDSEAFCLLRIIWHFLCYTVAIRCSEVVQMTIRDQAIMSDRCVLKHFSLVSSNYCYQGSDSWRRATSTYCRISSSIHFFHGFCIGAALTVASLFFIFIFILPSSNVPLFKKAWERREQGWSVALKRNKEKRGWAYRCIFGFHRTKKTKDRIHFIGPSWFALTFPWIILLIFLLLAK